MTTETFIAAKEEVVQRGVTSPPLLPQIIVAVLIFAGLLLLRMNNYLMFHAVVELFTIAIVWAVFILIWNLRLIVANNYLLLVGVGLVFVSIFDLLHTIAYKGMNILPGSGADLGTQLWIAARYVESLTFLLTPFFVGMRVRLRFAMIVYVFVGSMLLLSIFVWKIFPVCYIDAEGRLSVFKIVSEFVISFLLLSSIGLLVLKRRNFDHDVLVLLIAAISCKIVSELSFSFYSDVFGIINVIGHYLKFISYYLIYYALVRASIIRPYNAIFRELSENELRLISEKEKLTEALAKIKTLSGFLPICANCKRVRDDEGSWNTIEKYVASHSSTRFSHGLCPDCARSMYPDLVDKDIDQP